MMGGLLALSDDTWVIVVAMFINCFLTALGLVLGHLAKKETAAKVDEVAVVLKAKDASDVAKMDSIAHGVEAVHLATNSMKDELVRATKDGALLQGAADERERTAAAAAAAQNIPKGA